MIDPATATLISAAIGLFSSNRMRRDAKRRAAEALKRQQEQQALLDEEIQKYRAIEFENPYADIQNPFEDLTVNQQAAQFQAEQIQQQQANLLEGFRSAAGSSGIAGLAQVLANQGALQTQRIAAQIGKQETANRLAAAKGQLSVELAERKGEALLQNMEASKQATLLGMQQSILGAAQANLSQSDANRMSAQIYGNQLQQAAMTNAMNNFMTAFTLDAKAGNIKGYEKLVIPE